MRYLTLVFIALCASCSMAKRDDLSLNKVTTTFVGGTSASSYNIQLSFTNTGQFDFLTSTATAQVDGQFPSARDEALKSATMRAKQQLMEFLHSELLSERFIYAVTKSIEYSDAVPKHKGTASNAKLAYLVRDSTQQKSEAIIQSAYVQDAVLDLSSGLIVVTMRAGRKE